MEQLAEVQAAGTNQFLFFIVWALIRQGRWSEAASDPTAGKRGRVLHPWGQFKTRTLTLTRQNQAMAMAHGSAQLIWRQEWASYVYHWVEEPVFGWPVSFDFDFPLEGAKTWTGQGNPGNSREQFEQFSCCLPICRFLANLHVKRQALRRAPFVICTSVARLADLTDCPLGPCALVPPGG